MIYLLLSARGSSRIPVLESLLLLLPTYQRFSALSQWQLVVAPAWPYKYSVPVFLVHRLPSLKILNRPAIEDFLQGLTKSRLSFYAGLEVLPDIVCSGYLVQNFLLDLP